MMRLVRENLRDFLAVTAMVAIGVGIVGYILTHQRFRFPLIEDPPFLVKAEFSNARGVMPGQGQTVRVSGMRVGDIGKIDLEDGLAVVEMELDPEYDDLVRADATALLRPRTGLKDMFIELDPGSDTEPALAEGDRITVQNTAPDMNADEVLSALDTDTRAYLKLLISGAGKGLYHRGGDLREVFRRLGPLFRDIRRLQSEVAKRRENLARLVHNYSSTISRLSREDESLASLVTSSNRAFQALASEDRNISLAVSRLPSTLAQAEDTLLTVDELGDTMGPAFEALRPAVRELDDANREVLPFALEATPILRDKVRPLVRTARPWVGDLRPAAIDLARASPDLRESFFELNRFFNIAAYNPNDAEPLTGNLADDLRRDEGYLFWLAWVANNGVSLFSTGDAQGPFRRFIVSATCTTFDGLVQDSPSPALTEAVLGVRDLLADASFCP